MCVCSFFLGLLFKDVKESKKVRVNEDRIDFLCPLLIWDSEPYMLLLTWLYKGNIIIFLILKIEASGSEQFAWNYTDGKDLGLNPGQSD